MTKAQQHFGPYRTAADKPDKEDTEHHEYDVGIIKGIVEYVDAAGNAASDSFSIQGEGPPPGLYRGKRATKPHFLGPHLLHESGARLYGHINIRTADSILKVLLDNAKETGFLHLPEGDRTIIIPSSRIVSIKTKHILEVLKYTIVWVQETTEGTGPK